MKIMNPEERDDRIQRQLEFLAASQAQHDARMAEISKTLAENSKTLAENSKTLAENSKQIAENSRRIGENAKQIAQLGDFILRIGRIVEKQEDRRTGEYKYLVEGQTLDYESITIVAKLSVTGKLVIITVYA